MANIIQGVELCPYCDYETAYAVPEGVWVTNCSNCGRPILLCDKCAWHDNCANCPHKAELDKATAAWVKNQIGRVVYWRDPDGDQCSDYCRVTGIREDTWVLEHIEDTWVLEHIFDNGADGEIEALAGEIDFISEEKQAEVLANAAKKRAADPSSRRA